MKTLAEKYVAALKGKESSVALYNTSVFVQGSGWNSSEYAGRFYRDRAPFPVLVMTDKEHGITYYSEEKCFRLSRERFIKYWQKPSVLNVWESQYKDITSKLENWYRKLTYDYIKSQPIAKLERLTSDVIKTTQEMNIFAFSSVCFDQTMVRSYFSEINEQIADIDKIWKIPVRHASFEQRWFRLVRRLRKSRKLWTAIGEYCQYCVTDYNYFPTIQQTVELLKKRYRNIEKYNLPIARPEGMGTISFKGRKLFRYVSYVTRLRDNRKDYILKGTVMLHRIAERFFHEAGLPRDLIRYYPYDELQLGVRALIENRRAIVRRESGYAVLVDSDGRRLEWYGNYKKDLAFMQRQIASQHAAKRRSTNYLTGEGVSKGKVTGAVCLVRNYKADNKRFKAKSILVAGMTRPEYVPLMKQALAVVTDEGGITCHAAIVSRELGIPCVIGTKIATQVLKDGDRVEVDATNGVVRKI